MESLLRGGKHGEDEDRGRGGGVIKDWGRGEEHGQKLKESREHVKVYGKEGGHDLRSWNRREHG